MGHFSRWEYSDCTCLLEQGRLIQCCQKRKVSADIRGVVLVFRADRISTSCLLHYCTGPEEQIGPGESEGTSQSEPHLIWRLEGQLESQETWDPFWVLRPSHSVAWTSFPLQQKEGLEKIIFKVFPTLILNRRSRRMGSHIGHREWFGWKPREQFKFKHQNGKSDQEKKKANFSPLKKIRRLQTWTHQSFFFFLSQKKLHCILFYSSPLSVTSILYQPLCNSALAH